MFKNTKPRNPTTLARKAQLHADDARVVLWLEAGRPHKGELADFVGNMLLSLAVKLGTEWNYKHGSSTATADDCIQWCFSRLHRQINKWRPGAGMAFSTYMWKAMRNTMISNATQRAGAPLFGPHTSAQRTKLGMDKPYLALDEPAIQDDERGESKAANQLVDEHTASAQDYAEHLDEFARIRGLESQLIPKLTSMELLALSVWTMWESGATNEEMNGLRTWEKSWHDIKDEDGIHKDLDNALTRVRKKASMVLKGMPMKDSREWMAGYAFDGRVNVAPQMNGRSTDKRVHIGLSAYERYNRAAKLSGMSLAQWMRVQLDEAARCVRSVESNSSSSESDAA